MRRKIRRSLRTSSPAHRRVFRPVLGWLEARTLLSGNPTYYTVNLTSDTGAGSGTDVNTGNPSGDLLWAIEQANANTNPCGSVINFDPTVFATSQTITLSSTLELWESAGPEVIDATGIAGTVIISGNNEVGVFQLDGGVTATLNGSDHQRRLGQRRRRHPDPELCHPDTGATAPSPATRPLTALPSRTTTWPP